MAHGSGGKLSHELIEKVFLPRFANPTLSNMDDSAALSLASALAGAPGACSDGTRLAFTTDSYVVKPLFWAGGNIGRLAVSGTVNDLSMIGAQPLYLTAGFILEEGLPMSVLADVAEAMKATADEAGVSIVAGDTKVVEKGGADGLFINTAGVGVIPPGRDISGRNAKPGDVVIVSGYIGDHGIAVLSRREGLEFGTDVTSDVAPLNGLVETMLAPAPIGETKRSRGLAPDPIGEKKWSREVAASPKVRVLRDPTRGGLATTLNEIAQQSNVGIRIYEEKVPVRQGVAVACELLGYDPLYVANEGKLVAVVAREDGERILEAMRRHRYGQDAAIIGEITAEPKGKVLMKTGIGGTRIVNMLMGELLPRIC